MNEPQWHVVRPNPELRRYKVVCAVNPPPGTVSSHAEMGDALVEKGRLEMSPAQAAVVDAEPAMVFGGARAGGMASG